MEIKLNQEELTNVIHTALCNGLQWITSYGLFLDVSSADKQAAREHLSGDICFEDVLIQHLKLGKSLDFNDIEADEIVGFTLEQARVNLESEVATRFLMDVLNETDDAITADCILQICIYGEVIFG